VTISTLDARWTYMGRSRLEPRAVDRDTSFLARARAGETAAFAELVRRHSPELFRLAYRLTRQEQDAEDVVQETFLRAFRQLGRFNGRSSLQTWLYRIALNCATDLLRKRRREAPEEDGETLPSALPSPESAAAGAELQRRLTAAFSRLSASENAAFVLRHVEALPIEEIGRVLGVSRAAAKHTVFRAVRKLREALGPRTGQG
jgi:RNA polymerase sigma-70 factor (ECF subfamily)